MSDFSRKRIFGLDVVRSFAIVMVLISHARQALVDPDSGLVLTFGGWFGVELFFALSGFLIGTILIKLFTRRISPSRMGRFWFRRWMRTLPAYFFLLIIYWGVFGQVQFSDFILLQWPINHNQGVIPVSWSLAVEEWFYIIFPLTASASAALFRKRGMLVAIMVSIAIPLFFRVYQYNFGMDGMAIRVNPFRFDGMAYGVLAAYLMTKPTVRAAFEKNWLTIAFAAALLFTLDFLRYNGARIGFPLPFRIPAWHDNITSYMASGLCAALIVIIFYLHSPHIGKICSSLIMYISKISYSLYLWHLLIFRYALQYFQDSRGVTLYFAVIAAAILLSCIPYILIEVPFMKVRDYFTSNRRSHQKSVVGSSRLR